MSRGTGSEAGAALYGKLPGAADFVMHNLPPRLIDSWDSWLRGALSMARVNADLTAQEAFYDSPPWRFWLRPGAFDSIGWVGVLVSSADRVGRPYPLTLARPVTAEPKLQPMPNTLALDNLESTALRMIDDQFAADAAIAALAHAVEPAGDGPAEARRAASFGLDLPGGMENAIAEGAATLWWQYGWTSQPAALAAAPSAPPPAQAAALWLADWAARGWRRTAWGWMAAAVDV